MSAIRIHRCRLRLVRHGGWSWGPDLRALLQAALRALPALLAAALEGLWTADEDDREIVAPVRLRVRLRAGELLLAHAGFSGQGPPPAGSPAAEIARRMAASLAVALAVELPRERNGGEEPPGLLGSPQAPGSIAAPHDRRMEALLATDLSLLRLLRAWQDRGDLAARLALLSEVALETWVEGLLREDLEAGHSFPSSFEPGTAEPAGDLAPLGEAGDRAVALRAWLMSAVEAGDRRGIEVEPPTAARLRRGSRPIFQSSLPIAAPAPVSLKARRPRPAATASSVRPMPWRDADVHIPFALPFLLLGPLSRTGFLETLAATFAAAGLLGDLPLFAAALAYKVLPPPERGWRRTPEAMGAAAACTGLLDPVSGEDLSGLSRRASECLEPLAADLATSLLAGHEPGRPLLLAAAGDGLLLAEVDGVFPIAWASGFEGLSPVLARLRDETLLVPTGIATSSLLREIDALGHRFVTAAPPTRGEPWRPLRLPGGYHRDRVWTNDPAVPGLARQAAGLAVAEEGARRLWQALGVERPILPAATDPAFDRHLTLAAGVALGTLAWTLWREREPVDPILALERFGDLDARVRFREHSVHVVLPLGRRHHDLFEHRLLEPVRDAVWLGGRVLEFGGG
jgi:hypothetical protein